MYAQVYIDAISIHHIYDVIVYFVLFKKAPYLSDHMCCVLKTPRCLSGWLSSFRRGSGHCVCRENVHSSRASKPTHEDLLTTLALLGLGRRVRPGSGLARGEVSAVRGGDGVGWASSETPALGWGLRPPPSSSRRGLNSPLHCTVSS